MKHLVVFSLLFLMTVAIKAQDMDSTTRNISLIILAKKERPMRNIFVRTLSNTEAGITNRKGLFVFEDVSDYDTISMLLPRIGETLIPVAMMDSIVVKLQLARRYYYASNDGQREPINEKSKNFNKIKTEPTNLIDVQERLKMEPNLSIHDLIQEVAGVYLNSGFTGVNIRGPVSINGSNTPIIVVNGVRMEGNIERGDLGGISIYEIKTIEVQKDASGWGTFGANGAIVIKTR